MSSSLDHRSDICTKVIQFSWHDARQKNSVQFQSKNIVTSSISGNSLASQRTTSF